jgi:diguanylate cyclase (GGDEF)-like protein/PAS domain S-box-containing protein
MSTTRPQPETATLQTGALAQLQLALREQQVIQDTAGVGIVFIKKRVVIRCNQRFAEFFGHTDTRPILGSANRSLFPSDAAFRALGQAAYPVMVQGLAYKSEVQMKRRDGELFWTHMTGKLVNPADTDEGSIWIVDDISEHKAAQEQLQSVLNELLLTRENLEKLVEVRTQELSHMVLALENKAREQREAEAHIQQLAYFDPLTGLPNRLLLGDRCQHALSVAQRAKQTVALVFLDLDHFKNINDSLGHRVGDEVLVKLANRLKAAVREQDTVSRLGGDEFILLLPDTDAAGAARVADKLLQAALKPMLIEANELTVTPSIGIALYPKDGADLDALSRCADAAMYQAKGDGRNSYRFFTPDIQAHSDRALQLDNALRRALERQQLSLHYQPQISLATGNILGAEALLRWTHPELGPISPAEFIPIAERNGLILPIGEWVIHTAVQQLADWLARGMAPITMAVNLSAVQFRHADLPAFISRILTDAALPARLLELELTEGVAMTHPQVAIAVMADLHQRGVRLSIDDFGTGYSSLSYLKRFQVYKLKIDQSFVRDITEDPDDKAIVGAIISMASSLGLKTIAEGVETEDQLHFLRDRGCDEAQGYYFSPALPAPAFEDYVHQATHPPH